LKRFFEQFARRAILRGPEDANDVAAKPLKIGQVSIGLRDACPAKEDHVALVAGDEQILGNIWAIRDETHVDN
jgi:hypothetical protein